MFDSMTGSRLQKVVDQMYTETSKHLLEVFNKRFMFLDHLAVSEVTSSDSLLTSVREHVCVTFSFLSGLEEVPPPKTG